MAGNLILVLFLVEFIVKCIVMGFGGSNTAYIKDNWNKLDFTIIIISLTDLMISVTGINGIDLSFLRALRALRALRPLRMVSQNEKMKKVVISLIRAIPVVVNVILISLLFYIIFGILGVIFFKGTFYSCSDGSYSSEDECKENGNDWENADANFDNIFNSILLLFEVSTLEMWPDYMYRALDSTEPGKGPSKDHSPWAALYFVAFIFCLTFIIMNLYVGAVIKKFNEIQEELDGSYFLTPEQNI